MSYPGRMLNDGLCNPPAIEMPARQLLGVVCVCGGADCPLFADADELRGLIERFRADPAASVRLTSEADRIPHYRTLSEGDYAALDREDMLNRKRDLHVLQQLGLVPGDTRRARFLYELLFERIETPYGICAHDTPNWRGCPLARTGAYERVRARGWRAVVYDRSTECKSEGRRRSTERVRNEPVLNIRPHHLMCMSCWVGSTGGGDERDNDVLDEVWKRIRRDPEMEIRLVEGPCEACYCCDGFHPESGRCVHSCGLIRDYKKDLDVLQKLGLVPGDTMNARELLMLLYERIPSTTVVCGNGTGEATSYEWSVCGGPDGNPGYRKARETVTL